jgi:hypothetical protein
VRVLAQGPVRELEPVRVWVQEQELEQGPVLDREQVRVRGRGPALALMRALGLEPEQELERLPVELEQSS